MKLYEVHAEGVNDGIQYEVRLERPLKEEFSEIGCERFSTDIARRTHQIIANKESLVGRSLSVADIGLRIDESGEIIVETDLSEEFGEYLNTRAWEMFGKEVLESACQLIERLARQEGSEKE